MFTEADLLLHATQLRRAELLAQARNHRLALVARAARRRIRLSERRGRAFQQQARPASKPTPPLPSPTKRSELATADCRSTVPR